jgi:hypothetical protein
MRHVDLPRLFIALGVAAAMAPPTRVALAAPVTVGPTMAATAPGEKSPYPGGGGWTSELHVAGQHLVWGRQVDRSEVGKPVRLGVEYWVSDGTSSGTTRATTFTVGARDNAAAFASMTVHGGQLYFVRLEEILDDLVRWSLHRLDPATRTTKELSRSIVTHRYAAYTGPRLASIGDALYVVARSAYVETTVYRILKASSAPQKLFTSPGNWSSIACAKNLYLWRQGKLDVLLPGATSVSAISGMPADATSLYRFTCANDHLYVTASFSLPSGLPDAEIDVAGATAAPFFSRRARVEPEGPGGLFLYDDGPGAGALFFSDGSAAGTKELSAWPAWTTIRGSARAKGRDVLFTHDSSAGSPDPGYNRLVATDRTASATEALQDFPPGTDVGTAWARVGDRVYFTVRGGGPSGTTLAMWVTDGTKALTRAAEDLSGSYISDAVAFRDDVFFWGRSPSAEHQLHRLGLVPSLEPEPEPETTPEEPEGGGHEGTDPASSAERSNGGDEDPSDSAAASESGCTIGTTGTRASPAGFALALALAAGAVARRRVRSRASAS